MRIEPPVSVPMARSHTPAATSAADPPEDPPDVRDGSRGLRVSPTRGLAKPAANSRHWAVAKTSAPAARRRATSGASAAAGVSPAGPSPAGPSPAGPSPAGPSPAGPSPAGTAPNRVGRPPTAMMSLTATGRPDSGPPGDRDGAPATDTTALSGRPSRSRRS